MLRTGKRVSVLIAWIFNFEQHLMSAKGELAFRREGGWGGFGGQGRGSKACG